MAKFENDGKTFIGGILNDWDNFGYVASDSDARNMRRRVSNFDLIVSTKGVLIQ